MARANGRFAAPTAPPPPGWRPSLAARRAALGVLAGGHLSDADRSAASSLEAAVARLLDLPAGRTQCFASGSGALAAALLAAGARPGRHVLVPALAPRYVAGVVALTGARPVPVDVEPATLAMDPTAAHALLGPRAATVVRVLPLGHDAPGDPVQGTERGTPPVVEDAAQLLGERDDGGRPLGARTFAGTFSLAYGKALGAGEGGLVALSSVEAATRFEAIAAGGRRRLPPLAAFGRLPLSTAAVALASLPELDLRSRRRREVAARLDCIAAAADVQSLCTRGLPLWAGRFATAAAATRASARAARLRLELVAPPYWPPLRFLPASLDAVRRVRLLTWWDAGAAREAEVETLLRAFAHALGVAA